MTGTNGITLFGLVKTALHLAQHRPMKYVGDTYTICIGAVVLSDMYGGMYGGIYDLDYIVVFLRVNYLFHIAKSKIE